VSKAQTAETFWVRVKIGTDKDCWEWQGACNSTGYGTVAWGGKVYTAHRISAWLSRLVESPDAPKHKMEKGFVLHKCDNRKCCNPSHFFIGNYTDNQKDAYSKKRKSQPKGEKHVNSKLTMEEVKHIRMVYRNKWFTQVALAKEYGVSQITISLIVRGKTYK
jgi:hypothetical protein